MEVADQDGWSLLWRSSKGHGGSLPKEEGGSTVSMNAPEAVMRVPTSQAPADPCRRVAQAGPDASRLLLVRDGGTGRAGQR